MSTFKHVGTKFSFIVTGLVTLFLVIYFGFFAQPQLAQAEESELSGNVHYSQMFYLDGYWATDFLVDFSVNHNDIDGQQAYCAQASLDTPKPGTYSMEAFVGDTDENMALGAALWYGYGGPGFQAGVDAGLWPDTYFGDQTWTDTYYMILSDIVLCNLFNHDGDAICNQIYNNELRQWVTELTNDLTNQFSLEQFGILGGGSAWPEHFVGYIIDTGNNSSVTNGHASQNLLTYSYVLSEPVKSHIYTRLAGANRYETMSAISNEGFNNSDTVILASGTNYPDALSASGLAGIYGCPILLTAPDALSSDAAKEIERLGAQNIVVVGGENTIGYEVVKTLEDSGLYVERIAGADRYGTSLAVYTAGLDCWGDTVLFASGLNFADALCASSYAYWANAPILLVGSSINLDTLSILTNGNFSHGVIVGGENSVNTGIEYLINFMLPSSERIAGNNRYATSVDFAEWAYSQGMNFDLPAIATGKTYPDALAGGALCGKNGSTMLLIDDSNLYPVESLMRHYDEILGVYFLGGTNSVSADVEDIIKNSLG